MGVKGSRRIKLGILFGGRSGEHEVSVTSAASVIAALDPEEFEISAIGITKQGRLATHEEVRKMLPSVVQDRIAPNSVLKSRDSSMSLVSGPPALRSSRSVPDIIFPLLHGPYGEDGTIQGLLEIAGIPYIGSGVLASAVGMDKAVMKRLFTQAGLPVAPYRVFNAAELRNGVDIVGRYIKQEFGFPVFCKPANLGSSVGIRKIHREEEIEEAVNHAAQFDRKILIEKGIDARELECAVLGNDHPEASVVGEVLPAREFYDYLAKYVDPNSKLQIPAKISRSQAEQVRNLAKKAFEIIDGSGLARVDFFLERPTGTILVNEINTMPGFTPISMYTKLWAESGIPFEELIRRLIRLGFERHHERLHRRISMDDPESSGSRKGR